jgi:hypothetical protein
MQTMTRRDLWTALPALGALGGLLASAEALDPETQLLRDAAAFPFEQLTPYNGAHGMVSRPVLRGKLPTGEIVELHETTLMPGQMPHPPHRHTHTEFMLIREGTVEFLLRRAHNETRARRGGLRGLRADAWPQERRNHACELLCTRHRL